MLLSGFFSLELFAQSDSNLHILSPEKESVITGSLMVSLSIDELSGSGLWECSVRRTVSTRNALYSTGFVISPTEKTIHLSIDASELKYKKGNYHLICQVLELWNNTRVGIDSKRIRLDLPPPPVYFANTEGNLILNPHFSETRGELPAYWKRGNYGKNDYTQDFLLTGLVWKRSLRSTLYHYVLGDVKWYFQDVTVSWGKTYIYAQKYHTNTPARLIVRYTMKDGNYQYDVLKLLPVTEGPYASVKVYLVAPKDATWLTIWTSLSSVWSLTIDDVMLILSPGSE